MMRPRNYIEFEFNEGEIKECLVKKVKKFHPKEIKGYTLEDDLVVDVGWKKYILRYRKNPTAY